jgi:poly(3-hydroxybutyrate) depolymerase
MKYAIRARCTAAFLILTSPFVDQQATAADLGSLLKAFFESSDPPARRAAIAAILAAAPESVDLERGLRRGRSYPADVKPGWQVLTQTGSDGNARPYHVYAPTGYDPARKHPVIVSLHGGVNRSNLLTDEALNPLHADVGKDADQYGRVVIVPLGQRGATWYDRVGITNILAQLAAVKRRYNIDEDRVFLGGFSDGGSGAYIMGMYHPTPWAGFFASSGNLAGPSFGPTDRSLALGDSFPANLTNRPVHAANGGVDPLSPSALQKMFIGQLRQQGARIAWTDYPDSAHDGSYMDREDPKINQFLLTTSRDPAPKHIVWETADTRVGRSDWARIDEVRDVGNNRGPEPSNLIVSGPQFYLIPDVKFAGPGLRILQVPPGQLAHNAGLKPDDVLTQLAGVEIKTLADAQRAGLTKILAMKKGDLLRGEYRRGGAIHSFGVEVPELPHVPLFKRTGPAGRIEVNAKGNRVDVTVRGVARYTLFVQRGMFDLNQPIAVITNGAQSFNARVKPDLAFMLEQAAEDNDRTAIYCSKIEVKVPSGIR